MKKAKGSLKVVVLGGMGSEGYGRAWVERGIALARRHDRRVPTPRAVFVYRSNGGGSWGQAHMRTREIVLKLSPRPTLEAVVLGLARGIRRPRREINLAVLLHELRHLSQDTSRSRAWRERDAKSFAESVIEAERSARRKGGSK